jgi:hypothetical protein
LSLLIRGDAIVLKIQSAIAPGLHAASMGRAILYARGVPGRFIARNLKKKSLLRLLDGR